MKKGFQLSSEVLERAVAIRRAIHQNPELGYQEHKTAALIAGRLREIGIEVIEGVGKTGVVGVIRGGLPGKVAAVRADIDALPLEEATGLPFSSRNPGVSHMCGHDMHTAMLLGLAEVLFGLRAKIRGTVKLIFPPAEECNPTGAAPAMIAGGALENPHVDAVFAQHLWPELETGAAAVRNGSMMAASDRFFITIHGRTAHGSAPEEGIDAILCAAQVISALQSIVSREVGPRDSAVVTVGTIQGGDRYNVIAGEVKLEGTVRTLRPEIQGPMASRIERIVSGVCAALGASYTYEYVKGYPATVNDPALFEIVYGAMKDVVGEKALVPELCALTAEDFAFFTEQRPCVYYWLGCRNPQTPFSKTPPLHNTAFSPQEEAMPFGMEIMLRSVLRFLGSEDCLC